MSLRTAFDMDGVPADMDGAARRTRRPASFWKPRGEDGELLEVARGESNRGLSRAPREAATDGSQWEAIFLTKRPRSAGETARSRRSAGCRRSASRPKNLRPARIARNHCRIPLSSTVVVDDRPRTASTSSLGLEGPSHLIRRGDPPAPPAAHQATGRHGRVVDGGAPRLCFSSAPRSEATLVELPNDDEDEDSATKGSGTRDQGDRDQGDLGSRGCLGASMIRRWSPSNRSRRMQPAAIEFIEPPRLSPGGSRAPKEQVGP